jgi:pimeloyl-ACP methyl ester carboxylesterase
VTECCGVWPTHAGYTGAWTTGSALRELELTPAEREGRLGRIRPGRVLRAPAFAPVLRGIEPYSVLLAAVRRVVPDPAAVCEFGYDWRLPVSYNAQQLAVAAEAHLAAWRKHPQGSAQAQLVLVAHSMGGLLASYFTRVLGGDTAAAVRTTVTLGTPFYGAVKAAYILNTGRGGPVPLPRRRLRRLARTLPGLHDLLPAYRCVDEGDRARWLTPTDVEALGGDRELAEHSQLLYAQLRDAPPTALRVLVGVDQPTMQSIVLRDGVLDPQYYTCQDGPDGHLQRVNRLGDSTVYRESAVGDSQQPSALPQAHGAIARTEEAVSFVSSVLTQRPQGPPMGDTRLGLDLPDVLTTGVSAQVTALSVDIPTDVRGRVVDVETNLPVAPLRFGWRDGKVAASLQLPTPGVYRVEAKAGAASAVNQLVMAVPSEDDLDENQDDPDDES